VSKRGEGLLLSLAFRGGVATQEQGIILINKSSDLLPLSYFNLIFPQEIQNKKAGCYAFGVEEWVKRGVP